MDSGILIDEMTRQVQELESAIKMMGTLVSLNENICISYKTMEDELNIFMISGYKEHIDLYKGSLDTWRVKMLEADNVDHDYIDEFNMLCQDMECGEKFILHNVKLRLFDDDELKRKCIVNGKTIGIDGQQVALAVITFANDVSNLKEGESVASDMIDEVTGLLNRKAIEDFSRRFINSKPDDCISLGIIEIDKFDELKNDYDEDFINDLLKRSGAVIKEAVGQRGRAGRIADNQFLIAVEGLRDNESIRSVLRTIRNNIAWMYGDEGKQILKVACSIGAATFPEAALNYDAVFDIANKMLQLAITKGRDRYLIYIEELHGDYIAGGAPVDPKDKRFFKYRRIRTMNQFVRDFYVSSDEDKHKLIEAIGLSMAVDSIMIYNRVNQQKINVFGKDTTPDSIKFLEMNNFIPSFREDGLHTIDNVDLYQTRAPFLYEMFTQAGIKQSVFYIVGGNFSVNSDVLVAFYRNSQSKKWSELEISYFAIIGEMIGSDYLKSL